MLHSTVVAPSLAVFYACYSFSGCGNDAVLRSNTLVVGKNFP